MNDATDAYDFDVNQYERPNQKWDCGRSADGMPCPRGPGLRGTCGAVCEPYRDGDRFYCNNASMLSGQCNEGPLENGQCSQSPSQCRPAKRDGRFVCARGQCMQGPFPDGRCSNQFSSCQPVRSVLAKRRLFTFCVLALAIGVALVMVAGPYREPIVSPGPLVSAHATNRCVDCHVAGGGSFPDWVTMAFNPHTAMTQAEEKCLSCHQDLGENALHPHSQDPDSLAEITERVEQDDSYGSEPVFLAAARTVLGKPMPANNEFSCATCHQEHRGRNFDLTKLTNQQCQSCHVKVFHSFESGHPNFTSYPHRRRRRIHFDHGSHYGRHFALFDRIMPNGKEPASCLSCHDLDETGSKMAVYGFDIACASCHQAEITDDLLPGVPLFALPSIEIKSLPDDFSLGKWPAKGDVADSTALADGVPPLMLLLLSADTTFTDHIDVKRSSLDEAGKPERDALVQYTTAVRKLLSELASGDSARLRKRISVALGEDVSRDVTDQFVNLLTDEAFVGAIQKLYAAVEAIGADKPPPVSSEVPAKAAAGDGLVQDAMRGWIHGKDHSLRYRAERHADRTLRRLLELTGKLYGGLPKGEQQRPAGEAAVRQRAVENLFRQLTDVAAEGRCMKCHTADEASDRIVFNWERTHPDPKRRPYTDFSHAPHLQLLGDKACGNCHDRKSQWQRYRAEFVHRDWSIRTDPHNFSSDFSDMSPATCANCHQPSGARDNCLACHNYHVRDTGVFPHE